MWLIGNGGEMGTRDPTPSLSLSMNEMVLPSIKHVCNCSVPHNCTELGPRLRESHLLTPSGREGEFAQPRANYFEHLSPYVLQAVDCCRHSCNSLISMLKGAQGVEL